MAARGETGWGAVSGDLNATLLAWDAGAGPPEHVNDERDVLLVALEGAATVTVDGEAHELSAGEVIIVPKGSRRKITASEGGVRYLSVHVRRPPLQIRRLEGEGRAAG